MQEALARFFPHARYFFGNCPTPSPPPSKNNGRPSSVSVATLLDFEAYRMRNGSHSLSYIFYYLARVYVYFYGISPTSTFPNVRKPHQTNGLFLQGSISPPSTWVRGVTVETGAKTAVTSSATQHQCLCLFAHRVRRDYRGGYQRQKVSDRLVMAAYNCVNHKGQVIADENTPKACTNVQFFVHRKEGVHLGAGSL